MWRFLLISIVSCCRTSTIDVFNYVSTIDSHETDKNNPCFLYNVELRGEKLLEVASVLDEFICQKHCYIFDECKYFIFRITSRGLHLCHLYKKNIHNHVKRYYNSILGLKTCKINDIIYDMFIYELEFISLI